MADILQDDGTIMVSSKNTGGTIFQYMLLETAAQANEMLRVHGYRPFNKADWLYDNGLPQDVRTEMKARSLPYALMTGGTDEALYFHAEGRGSFAIRLKYLRLFAREDVAVDIDGTEYRYFMTNDPAALNKKLSSLHCLPPRTEDWKPNFALHKNVTDTMAKLGALYSLTQSHGASALNFYRAGGKPSIIHIDALYKKQQKQLLFGAVSRAIRTDDTKNLALLVRTKADAARPIMETFTPLMVAAMFDARKAAAMLIALGADVNAVTKDGVTALMLAAAKDSGQVARLLIERGADCAMKANNGWTAYVHALANGHEDLAALLSQNGGDLHAVRLGGGPVTFHETLHFFIARFISTGEHKACEIYQSLPDCLSKQTFSKLQSNDARRPTKRIVLLLAIGMRLPLSEVEELLSSAGLAFQSADTCDQIVRACIERGEYDIFRINDELWQKAGATLRSSPRRKGH